MKKAVFNSEFLIIFLLNFLFFTSHTSLNLLPPYLADLGATKGFIGFFMSINSMTLVLFVVFFSGKIGGINKKYIFTAGYVLQFFSLTAMFFFSGNLYLLFIFRFLASFSFAFGFTLNSLQAFEILPKGSRVSGIAFYGISGILANPAGSYLGELAVKYHHPKYLFLLACVFCLAALAVVPFIKDRRNKSGTSDSTFMDILCQKDLAILMVSASILGGAWSSLITFLPNFTKERLGTANSSAYFFSLSVIAILSRFFFSGFIDRVTKKSLIMISLALISLTMAFTTSIFFFWQLFIVGILYGVAHSILYPVLNTAFIESGGENDKLILNNMFLAFYTLGNVCFSSLLGIAGDFLGTAAIYILMGSLAAFGIPAVHAFMKLKTGDNRTD